MGSTYFTSFPTFFVEPGRGKSDKGKGERKQHDGKKGLNSAREQHARDWRKARAPRRDASVGEKGCF
jgi:hypothetical protein